MSGIVRLTKEEQQRLNLSEKLVMFYRQNPVEAAKDLLGVDLVWFQRKTLRAMWFKKYNLVLMSRGVGKSWLLALFAVLYGLLFPGVAIGVITPSFKQTEFLYDKISDFYEESAYLRAATAKFQKTTYRAVIKFHNRAFVEGLPLGTGEKVRGRRYNIILIDEYAFVSEDIIKKVIRPMMNVKKKGIENKYIISSTAYYTWNHYYLQYLLYQVMSRKKPELYGIHEYIFEDLLMVDNPPYELDMEVYKMMEMDTTREDYEMENLCKFPIENVGFISARLIDQCTPKRTLTSLDSPIEVTGEPNSVYSMGIDAARVAGGDNFAICIIKLDGGVKRLVHTFTLNGAPYQEMIFHIRRLMVDFNIVQINCDSGGGGTTIKDLLMTPYKTITGEVAPPILDKDDKDMQIREGLHILRMVNFTRGSVNDLYMRLKADMQHRTLLFPIDVRRDKDREFEKVASEIIETRRELLVLQAEGKGTYYQFDVPSGFKKDRATAIALGNQAANHFLEVYKEEEPSLADGFWVN